MVEAREAGRLRKKSEDFTQGMAQVQYKSDINAKSSKDKIPQEENGVNHFITKTPA